VSPNPDHEMPDDDRRSMFRRLSDAELQREVHDLRTRVSRLEEAREQVMKLPEAVSELRGALEVLTDLVTSRFDGITPAVEKASSVRTAIQFAGAVLVPIIVALIGGYVLIRTGGSTP
jgi:phage-related minor tail protein